MTGSSTGQKRRERLVGICESLPEVRVSGDQHLAFRIGKRTFAYYLDDHHGDGRIAVCCKAAPGEQAALVELDPDRFFVPAYLGARGWVGLRLDLRAVDWKQVSEIVLDSYRLLAPKRLAASASTRAAGRR